MNIKRNYATTKLLCSFTLVAKNPRKSKTWNFVYKFFSTHFSVFFLILGKCKCPVYLPIWTATSLFIITRQFWQYTDYCQLLRANEYIVLLCFTIIDKIMNTIRKCDVYILYNRWYFFFTFKLCSLYFVIIK